MLTEKINLHNAFVPCIQMEIMKEIAKTSKSPSVSRYADRINGYMEAIRRGKMGHIWGLRIIPLRI